jgi:DNA-binding MarR family transcriptional regulator
MRSRPGQRLTAAELAAWRGLLRIAVRLRREFGQQLAETHALSMADYDVLVRLAEQPGGRMRMAELADAILQPRSSLTRLVGDLERRGLVLREPSPIDGRGLEAVMTDAGRTLFGEAQQTHLAGVRERFLDRLTDDQLAQLAAAWAAIDPSALAPGPDET